MRLISINIQRSSNDLMSAVKAAITRMGLALRSMLRIASSVMVEI